ncbi:MAG: hypothetical protein IJ916_04030 [Paludibacteraceae bacterium]|nr:hypothetical protein [Paludibacteraceae bacterium]
MKFGLTQLEAVGVMTVAQNMSTDEAHNEIKAMSLDQKKYVTGYLAAVMASDGDIADVEVEVWSLMSVLCNLPTMTVGEALEFWNTH